MNKQVWIDLLKGQTDLYNLSVTQIQSLFFHYQKLSLKHIIQHNSSCFKCKDINALTAQKDSYTTELLVVFTIINIKPNRISLLLMK